MNCSAYLATGVLGVVSARLGRPGSPKLSPNKRKPAIPSTSAPSRWGILALDMQELVDAGVIADRDYPTWDAFQAEQRQMAVGASG